MPLLSGQILRASHLTDLLPTPTPYTPVNSGLVIGNGSLLASYMLLGKMCHVRWALRFGTTTSVPGDAYIGLPFAGVATGVDQYQVLAAYYLDSGTRNLAGVARIGSTASLAALIHSEGFVGAVTATNPFTWVTNDSISVTGAYEIA